MWTDCSAVLLHVSGCGCLRVYAAPMWAVHQSGSEQLIWVEHALVWVWLLLWWQCWCCWCCCCQCCSMLGSDENIMGGSSEGTAQSVNFIWLKINCSFVFVPHKPSNNCFIFGGYDIMIPPRYVCLVENVVMFSIKLLKQTSNSRMLNCHIPVWN